jgi:hypothetical protein|tara:strand:- start:1223 stop:2134 length:912 start_codon:yes stop_codon:yes gene_type:complete
MAITRGQLLKELVPGLHAIFGTEYKRYEDEAAVLFESEKSNRAFEEEVLFPGFGEASVKFEGQGVDYANTGEGWVARYTNETVAMAFSITEEAMEDNLYDKLSTRLTKALARSMAAAKQTKGAAVYNNSFTGGVYAGGDGVSLINSAHPLQDGSTASNTPSVQAELSETSLEQALIDIAGFTDDKSIPIAAQARTLHIPRQLVFVAERLMASPYRVGTADNDVNAIVSKGMVPGGYHVNHRFTNSKYWWLRTDVPNGMKHFTRTPIETKMEGDFETGNVRYKSRERYVFGFSDWRGLYGSNPA